MPVHVKNKPKITAVYAIGVTLLELVAGRPAEGLADDDDDLTIAMDEALETLEDDDDATSALTFTDKRLTPPPPQDDVVAVLKIVLECIRTKYKQRPDVPAVLTRLQPLFSAAVNAEDATGTDQAATLTHMLGLLSSRQQWVSTDKNGGQLPHLPSVS